MLLYDSSVVKGLPKGKNLFGKRHNSGTFTTVFALLTTQKTCQHAVCRLASDAVLSGGGAVSLSKRHTHIGLGDHCPQQVLCQVVSLVDTVLKLLCLQGAAPTVMGVFPYSGLKFWAYQKFKRAWSDAYPTPTPERPPIYASLAFGAFSGLVAQTVTYPLDVVRRRMQVCELIQIYYILRFGTRS